MHGILERPATRAIAAAAVALLALTGCSQLPVADDVESRARDDARARVEQLVSDIAYDRNDDIDFAARRAVQAAGENSLVQLIGITATEPAAIGDSFGSLEFRVPEGQTVDNQGVATTTGPYCFRVGFNYYGADEGAPEQFDCPADAPVVTPPPDTTVYPTLAENAREAARNVLTEIAASGDTLTTDEIAARIRAELIPPSSALQSLAEPFVADVDGRIGVAMQDSSDCVLVSLVDGAVADVYPPAVLLQPGELGCSPTTAVADPEQLQSPH
ncbi:outer membrane murein-binding lipoprotein Lpp [Conyzicola lurida]|uniref:Outer membrane murein-binding lipoprotein Lpp n=1 Tax=Conyzicola lurida TaxID=1172621 RepID=A0A841APR2_9MICO|nr:hypothetical protein [Conyzicola lurida]MBB5843751.1 outer membrane murein-binding lipoprotein Lpp [Conyzicola lurida]